MFGNNPKMDEQRFQFNRGEGSIALKQRDIGQILADAFDNLLYNLVGKVDEAREYNWDRNDKKYFKNSIFWKETLLSYNHIGQRIKLKDFSVIEWLPSSPGLFFTGKAENSRRRAEQYFEPSRREFLPLGKLEMVLGGVGSVRLSSEEISNKTKYFLCATSSGASHEGIPLIVDRNIYTKIISEIKDNGYCKGEIVGIIEILHTEKSIITFDREVPKYCIIVEDFIRSNEKTENINVSIATAFQSDEHSWKYRRDESISDCAWTFCTFEPKKGDTNLTHAVRWINDYTQRYSGASKIICDFDEHRNHFQDVEFTVKEIMTSKFSKNKLQEFSHIHQININKVIMGDNFENISGTVINRSIVSNSLNKVREQVGEEDAMLLQHLTEQVEKSGNKDAVELMEGFHQEIQKPEPKKSLLKSFWSGVVTAVPALITNADKVVNIIEKVGKMLPH